MIDMGGNNNRKNVKSKTKRYEEKEDRWGREGGGKEEGNLKQNYILKINILPLRGELNIFQIIKTQRSLYNN